MKVASQEVTLIDHMGDDLAVANAARVSFKKVSQRFTDNDTGLIRFLASGLRTKEREALEDELIACANREEAKRLIRRIRKISTHFTPFTQTSVKFRLKCPIFVARQLAKHQVGFTVNEVSRRYVDEEPEFWLPELQGVRARATDVKQGSAGILCDSPWLRAQMHGMTVEALNTYRYLLGQGVCPEQARIILPQNTMTEWVATSSLYGWSRLCNQRLDPHAQAETGEIARLIVPHMERLFPVSWEALVTNG